MLFVILAVLVLVGLVVGYIYLNKPSTKLLPQITSQIQNSNKTYQNTALNFELQYVIPLLNEKANLSRDCLETIG